MEFVLTGTALFGGYGSILGADNRITNGTIFHTAKVKVEIALEYSQCIDNVAVLKGKRSFSIATFITLKQKKHTCDPITAATENIHPRHCLSLTPTF